MSQELIPYYIGMAVKGHDVHDYGPVHKDDVESLWIKKNYCPHPQDKHLIGIARGEEECKEGLGMGLTEGYLDENLRLTLFGGVHLLRGFLYLAGRECINCNRRKKRKCTFCPFTDGDLALIMERIQTAPLSGPGEELQPTQEPGCTPLFDFGRNGLFLYGPASSQTVMIFNPKCMHLHKNGFSLVANSVLSIPGSVEDCRGARTVSKLGNFTSRRPSGAAEILFREKKLITLGDPCIECLDNGGCITPFLGPYLRLAVEAINAIYQKDAETTPGI